MNDRTRRRLEDAGTTRAPAPDPAFADALEARLRAIAETLPPVEAAAGTTDIAPGSRSGGPGRRRRAAALGMLAAAAVVVLAVALVADRSPARTPSATLVASVNVEVALADGTILEDPAGLLLPDGAVITVGSGGSARIGGTDLGPGDVATVRHGHLDISHPPEGLVQTPLGTAPSAHPTGHGAGSSGPTATPANATDPGGTPPPRSATPRPTGPASTANPTSRATAAATASPQPVIRRPRLRVRILDNGRLAITWTATERARSYVLAATLSRNGPARDPVYPGSRVLGQFTEPPPTPLRYRVPDGVVEVRLQVIALRPNGTVLRRSVIVTVAVPLPIASGSSGGTIETAPAGTTAPVRSPVPTGDASPVPDPTSASEAPGAGSAAP